MFSDGREGWQAVFNEWKSTFTFRTDRDTESRVILEDYRHVLDVDTTVISPRERHPTHKCGWYDSVSEILFCDTRFCLLYLSFVTFRHSSSSFSAVTDAIGYIIARVLYKILIYFHEEHFKNQWQFVFNIDKNKFTKL